MVIDKRAIRDSLEKIQGTLAKITDSRRQLHTAVKKLKGEAFVNAGMLEGLYRIRQQYIDTIEDFDGEDTAVLSERLTEEWNMILQKIQYFEGKNEDKNILIDIYFNARELMKEDETELLGRKRKLEVKLWGSGVRLDTDSQLIMGQGLLRSSFGGRSIPPPNPNIIIRREAQKLAKQMRQDMEDKQKKKRKQKWVDVFYFIMLALGSVGALVMGMSGLFDSLATILLLLLGSAGGLIALVEALSRASD